MKLFDFYKKEHYGLNYVFTLLKGKQRSLFQFEFGFLESPDLPYLQISFGNNRLIDILFWCWRFSFAMKVLGITWTTWE